MAFLPTASHPTHLATLLSHHFLLVALPDSIRVYDLDTYALVSVYSLPSPLSVLATSPLRPLAFMVPDDGPAIYMLDLGAPAPQLETFDGGKRSVTALAVHASKPLLAAGDRKGVVRLYEYGSHTCRYAADEYAGDPVKKKLRSPVTALAFHPYKDILVVGSAGGRLAAWDVGGAAEAQLLAVRAALPPLATIRFHPLSPLVLTLSTAGDLAGWKLGLGRRDSRLKLVGLVQQAQLPFSPPSDFVMHRRFNYVAFCVPPPLAAPCAQAATPLRSSTGNLLPLSTPPQLAALVDGLYAAGGGSGGNELAGGLFSGGGSQGAPAIHGVVIHTLLDPLHPGGFLPVVAPYALPQAAAMYSDRWRLMAFHVLRCDNNPVRKIALDDNAKVVRVRRAVRHGKVAVVLATFPEADAPARHPPLPAFDHDPWAATMAHRLSHRSFAYISFHQADAQEARPRPGRDVVFVGEGGDAMLVLGPHGKSATVAATADETQLAAFALDNVWHRVFATPLRGARVVLYYDIVARLLVPSANIDSLVHPPNAYMPSSALPLPLGPVRDPHASLPAPSPAAPHIRLPPQTVVSDVVWDTSGQLGAVVTPSLLLVVDSTLAVLTSYASSRASELVPFFLSAVWLAGTLLYSTPVGVGYLTPGGYAGRVCSLDLVDVVLVAGLPDRLVYAHRVKKRVTVGYHAVGMLEPRLAGKLYGSAGSGAVSASALLELMESYDGLRVSRSFIDKLRSGATAVERELALALLLARIGASSDCGQDELVAVALELAGELGAFGPASQLVKSVQASGGGDGAHGALCRLGSAAATAGALSLAHLCYVVAGEWWAEWLLRVEAGEKVPPRPKAPGSLPAVQLANLAPPRTSALGLAPESVARTTRVSVAIADDGSVGSGRHGMPSAGSPLPLGSPGAAASPRGTVSSFGGSSFRDLLAAHSPPPQTTSVPPAAAAPVIAEQTIMSELDALELDSLEVWVASRGGEIDRRGEGIGGLEFDRDSAATSSVLHSMGSAASVSGFGGAYAARMEVSDDDLGCGSGGSGAGGSGSGSGSGSREGYHYDEAGRLVDAEGYVVRPAAPVTADLAGEGSDASASSSSSGFGARPAAIRVRIRTQEEMAAAAAAAAADVAAIPKLGELGVGARRRARRRARRGRDSWSSSSDGGEPEPQPVERPATAVPAGIPKLGELSVGGQRRARRRARRARDSWSSSSDGRQECGDVDAGASAATTGSVPTTTPPPSVAPVSTATPPATPPRMQPPGPRPPSPSPSVASSLSMMSTVSSDMSEAARLLRAAMRALESGSLSKCQKAAVAALSAARERKQARVCAGYVVAARLLKALKRVERDGKAGEAAALAARLAALPLHRKHRAVMRELASARDGAVAPHGMSVDDLAGAVAPSADVAECSWCGVRTARPNDRNLLYGLISAGISATNSLHSAYAALHRPVVHGELRKLHRQLADTPHGFPLIAQAYYPNAAAMIVTPDLPVVAKLGHAHAGYGKMRFTDAESLDDFKGVMAITPHYCTVEPYIEWDHDLRIQKIGECYRVFKRVSPRWKGNVGNAGVVEEIELTPQFKAWIDAASGVLGGLDICALDLLHSSTDDSYHILELNDTAIGLVNAVALDDMAAIRDVVLRNMTATLVLPTAYPLPPADPDASAVAALTASLDARTQQLVALAAELELAKAQLGLGRQAPIPRSAPPQPRAPAAASTSTRSHPRHDGRAARRPRGHISRTTACYLLIFFLLLAAVSAFFSIRRDRQRQLAALATAAEALSDVPNDRVDL
ncbi:synapsin short isoform [Thecamonas trahens ATCC 50062]|uniref:Synapsin short isoform n=1 Tax=Thecamonas trahens ATCC 50062 TaxID=461836 RepID=A0A0L0DJF8_THETB|nr:synapsin short isoform [Thecamonas trahens ATCC 50062]KNC52544.1 synapsin short isoform [Thecamonas trahens ATCC 50062]|eukprot:XP_013755335.1 synapsin short isoform [Thecamonas trahens ATCC 50062]